MASGTLPKAILRRNPLLSFLQRESPSSLPSFSSPSESTLSPYSPSSSSSSSSSSTTNPFAPTKKPNSRQWNAPRYSLRRQKSLLVSALQQGYDPSIVLPPPHQPHLVKPPRALGQIIRPSAHIPTTSILEQVGLEKKGPYKGRKGAAFKGKTWERMKEKRQHELKTLLEGADERERVWRESLKAEKKKGKSAMPF